MKIIPVADRIIIEPDEIIESIGGIELPGEAQERPLSGTVFAVGDGNMGAFGNIPLSSKLGDRVAYSKFSGTELTFEGKKYLIMRDQDVLYRILEE